MDPHKGTVSQLPWRGVSFSYSVEPILRDCIIEASQAALSWGVIRKWVYPNTQKLDFDPWSQTVQLSLMAAIYHGVETIHFNTVAPNSSDSSLFLGLCGSGVWGRYDWTGLI